MSTLDFLSKLRRSGVRLWIEGDKLRYSSPKGSLSPELRSELAERKAELIFFLRNTTLSGDTTMPQIEPVFRTGPLPLSYAQERLWFMDQLMPGNIMYNEHSAVSIKQPLDIEILKRSLNEIVRRHEILRTTFVELNGQPIQVISPSLRINLPVDDLTSLPSVLRIETGKRIAGEEATRPFDLASGPLVRTRLLKLGVMEYIFLLTMHHIVCDGWSMGLFSRELTTLYAAYAAGKPSPLPELPIQYADYASWQRNWLQGDVLERHLSYWKQQMTGLAPLEMPADRPRPAIQTFRGASEAVKISSSLTQELKVLCQREGVTLFMALLAAFDTLLYRYTSQDDVTIGTYIAGRNRAEIEKLIGFFINTLVLRTDLSGNPTFWEILSRVRDVTLGAYAHQDMPFPKLVETLQPERDLSRNPLFQIVFQLVNVPTVDRQYSSELQAPIVVERTTANFDLVLNLSVGADGLFGSFEYSTELFDAATIKRLTRQYQSVLQAVAADPGLRLNEIPLLAPAEREQIVTGWNATENACDYDRSLVQRFEELAERTPEATAFLYQQDRLSYRELNMRANRLAHYLRSLGVGPEVLVGICLERSLDLPVALLGVFKAGGAYLPLDPSYPLERLGFMLEDAHSSILISHQDLLESLPVENLKRVCLDTDVEELACQNEENPSRISTSNHLAYVIYTSGSTGKPKGVAVEHKQILNRLAWMWKAYPFGEEEVNCQKTALSFVDSIWEFFGGLLQSRPTIIIPEEVVKDPYELVKVLAEQRVSRIWIVPSFLRMMLDTYPDLQGRLPCLKFWVVTGEALPAELLERFYEIMPESVLYNLYGTSEVWDVTWYDTQEEQESAWHVPIGRPIQNMHAYALDSHLQPVPVGVPGELYIGGVGVARGYVGRPELTARHFLPDPFACQAGARLYKTGDLVRFRPDGNLEYLGRMDHQVKVRGYRIELGELEAVLQQHPGVKQAAAAVRQDGTVEQRILAYVIQNPDYTGSFHEPSTMAWSTEQIPRWREIWDEAYRQPPKETDPTFNIVGFNSSYDGLPMPAEEVREWVTQAVDVVLDRHPRRVLDIGCGMGLLLFRIAPNCTDYLGTDISPVALNYLRRQLAAPGTSMSQVQLQERPADDFTGIEDRSFDVVILHSVVQYFPNVDYLVQVLKSAVQVVAPGGLIFVGDVRSLPLLEAFHTDVELERAPASLLLNQFKQAVQKRMSQDKELALHPAFFSALQQQISEIKGIRIELKRGHQHNEFSRFRYNVLLYVGQELPEHREHTWLDWEKHALTILELKEILRNKEPELLGVKKIPNSRLARCVTTADLLSNPVGIRTIGQLRETLDGASLNGIDPEDLWSVSQELPYSVQVCWSSSGAAGEYDVLFKRQKGGGNSGGGQEEYWLPDATVPLKPWNRYANNPLQGMFALQLVPQLRQFLQVRLPEYMLPANYVLLNSLPKTPSGKIDRRRLPTPDQLMPQLETTYVAPRNPVEEILASLFANVLGLEQVGVHDHFFTELGGHSLLATQLVSKIRSTLQVELPLRTVFDQPTVSGLASILQNDPNTGHSIAKTAELALMVMNLSDEEVQTMLSARSHPSDPAPEHLSGISP
jgi:amino acid adenylation domain-containing protein